MLSVLELIQLHLNKFCATIKDPHRTGGLTANTPHLMILNNLR